jgi:hypothetical protein
LIFSVEFLDKITKSKAKSYIYQYIVKDTKVTHSQIDQLVTNNKWLHDNVVEAYFQSLEIENFTVLTSRESHNFFVQHDHIEMIQSLDTANYLIAPICLNNHWKCVFIDIKQSISKSIAVK